MADKLSEQEIQKIKKRSGQIENAHSEKLELFKKYREMYFMDNLVTPRNAGVDKNDWKLTVSPASRNAVTGMKRLLDTSEINIQVKVGDTTAPESAKIEKGLKRILEVSGQMKRARVEKDANLSAVLWGPVVARAEALDDLIQVQKDAALKRRLMGFRKRSPFLITILNAEESFPDWGRYGMLAHVEKYRVRGAELREVWGVEDCRDETEYIVHDYMDLKNRVVWADGINGTLFDGPHELPDMNVFVRYSGGSSLFYNPEEQLQSFLFPVVKGELADRDNLMLTTLYTSVFQQGLSGKPLLIEATEGTAPSVDIDYASGIKKIIATGAKIEMPNIPIIDGDLLQLKNMTSELMNESTIRGQTLGENISGATFSAMAMLSSAGKLPLIDPTEAIEQMFVDCFTHILDRIKTEGIENEAIKPIDIPDDFELVIRMRPRLPQDDLRNAQVAAQLQGLVSKEWIHESLLQIGDSAAAQKQIDKEMLHDAMLQQITQKPEIMESFIQAIFPQPKPQAPAPPPEGMMPQGMMPPDQMPQEGMPPDMMQGQPPNPAMGGMEAMPQGGPMIPPEERM